MFELENEDLEELLIQKEKELQQMNKQRQRDLEEELLEKTQLVQECQNKLLKLQGDFDFNLKLIHERDAELSELDAKLSNLKQLGRAKEAEISELKAAKADSEE